MVTENTIIEQINECREIHHYILHTGTKRIHVDSCDAEDRMSEKNRKEVDDSIYNLVMKGYIVCGNCKVGIKNANAFIEAAKLKNEDIMSYDVGDLPSYDEYVKSIENMGEWYATHVSTYRANFQTETLETEFNKGCYIKEYDIDQERYNVVVDKDTEGATFSTQSEIKVQRASKDAIEFYKTNKNRIKYKPFTLIKNTAYYPCDLLNDVKDDYNMAGDDCVRFFSPFANSIKNDFTCHLKNISKIEWSKINTAKLVLDNKKIVDAMYKLGYEIYDMNGFARDVDEDGKVDYFVKTINNDFSLRCGDILVRKNHLHIYLDNGQNPANNYGWGRVYREYPRKYSFTKKNDGGYYYIINEENDEDLKYTRIFRYIGKENKK